MIEIGLGIDVGSTTVKLVVVSGEGELLANRYVRSNGQPRETLLATSRLLDEQFPGARVVAVGLTGSGGAAVADLVGGIHANELVTQTRAVGIFHPEARTVIEIGGQDSKFLSVEWDATSGQMLLALSGSQSGVWALAFECSKHFIICKFLYINHIPVNIVLW